MKSFFRGEALRTFKAKGAASYGHSGDSGARAKEQRRHNHGAGIQAGAWATATHPARECGRAGRSAQGSRAPHAAKVRREVVSAAGGAHSKPCRPLACAMGEGGAADDRASARRAGIWAGFKDEISQAATKGQSKDEQAPIQAREGEKKAAGRFFQGGLTLCGSGARNIARFFIRKSLSPVRFARARNIGSDLRTCAAEMSAGVTGEGKGRVWPSW